VIRVTGGSWSPAEGGDAEIADCTLQFENGAIATLSASRAGQRKLRSVQIFTRSTLADIDLLRADVTIYRNVRQEQPDTRALTYRAETIIDIPFVRHTGEPLGRQFEHFLDLIEGHADAQAELDGVIPPHEVAHLVEMDCLRASGHDASAHLDVVR